MSSWSLLTFIFIIHQSALVRPECSVCVRSDTCKQLDTILIAERNITIICKASNLDESSNNTELLDDAVIFDHNNTISNETSVLKTASISDISSTDWFFQNKTLFANVQYLNFSYNAADSFSGIFDSLIQLDLSHNAISNISLSQFYSPQLAHLDLSNNNILSLCNFSHSTLQYLTAQCNSISHLCLGKFPKLTSVNLAENLISSIDAYIASQVPRLEILNLSSNAIAQLNDYNLNFSSLLSLHLGNNKITYLSEKCFYGLGKLQFLDISNNYISIVYPSMFQYIPLVRLVVSNNPDLMTQDFGILLASERLKSVDASRTNQMKIPACLTRTVRIFSLSQNKISQIQSGDLDSYPLLNSLDLSFNNISFIEDDALGRLELLETILLSYNQLKSVPYTLPSNLKALHLDHNHMSNIMPSDFMGLTKLQYLDLSESNVNLIVDGSFSQMYELISLNLSRNPIEAVSTGTFAGPHKLKRLDLSGLVNVTKCKQDLCFPVPEPNVLSELYIKDSHELGHRLMNDAAALKTFKQLNTLNMENCCISDISTEMPNYFPRLRFLRLGGNSLNCSKIQELYKWSEIEEVTDCTFVINEILSRTLSSTNPSGTTFRNYDTSLSNRITSPFPESKSTESLNVYLTNISIRYSQETEVISNEVWISDDQLGNVDAFNAEAPSSHPGLFILLLLPVALAGVVLFLNYSRLKRKMQTEQKCEMDIEISNISSELW